MMTRTMTGMLIVVLAMASSAHAVFNENFESYNVGDDVGKTSGSGWLSRAYDAYGTDNYTGAVIEMDTGTNGTQVGNLVDSAAWGTPYYTLDPADQFSSGKMTFDMLNYGGGSRTWFSDGPAGPGFASGGNLWVMNISWVSGESIFERAPGADLFDSNGNSADSPAFTSGQWHTYAFDFDFNGGTGGNGEWSLSIDGGSPILDGAMTTDGTSGGRSLQQIGWGVASGAGPLLDNISIVPEPATCMLFAGGLLCLLRRRA